MLYSPNLAFFTQITELPDILTQNGTKTSKNGQKSESFGKKLPSGNSELEDFFQGVENADGV